jgi:hypothetical protein
MTERQVVFYACENIQGKPTFDRLKAVSAITGLGDEEWRVPDGQSHLAVIVDDAGSEAKPCLMRLLRIRPDRPFKLSTARELSPVEVAENEAIAEFTWLILWKDNYLAGVSSRDAPSHKRLATYFAETSEQETRIVNLFQPDVLEKLKELREHGLRKVQFKLSRGEAAEIQRDERARGFGNLLKASRGTEAETIGIELSVGRAGPRAALSSLIGKSTQHVAAQYIDGIDSMHVKGYDKNGRVRELNLRQERIKYAVDITDDDTAATVYKEIRRARKAVEEDITSLGHATRGS